MRKDFRLMLLRLHLLMWIRMRFVALTIEVTILSNDDR